MSNNKNIEIRGARVNNLRGIDVDIPQNSLVVITGLSGSGKSSLAFQTLYAEGQRRFVESLSSYARQFLGRMAKPECDQINGLPPAIAIEQKVNTRNPRSTVGTSSEIYDYMRMLFARVGRTISPVSGEEVTKHSVEDVVKHVKSYAEGTRLMVLTPLVLSADRPADEQLDAYLKQGFTRLIIHDETHDLVDVIKRGTSVAELAGALVLVDRLTTPTDNSAISRLTDSVETAFFEGHGSCMIRMYEEAGVKDYLFSKRFEADGIDFEQPTDLLFNFNSPAGACPLCEGYGKVMGIDENLVVPDKTLSLMDDAIMCWRGEKLTEWKRYFIEQSSRYDFPIFTPYSKLTAAQKELLWHGTVNGKRVEKVEGIDDFFAHLESNLYKIQNRVMLARYRGKTVCPKCKGGRLRPEAAYVYVGGKNIQQLVAMTVEELTEFFDHLTLPEQDALIAQRLIVEIHNRLHFLLDVGLGYLSMNRLSNSLSGGESQRINLATSLGSSLVGSLYVLDEPSIGLHSRDSQRLIKVLMKLRDLGNTVVVVEHDEEIIRAADYIIDIGPDAGVHGGQLVGAWSGKAIEEGRATSDLHSYTLDFLSGAETIPQPSLRRKWNNGIRLEKIYHNNLSDIAVCFPLNVMTVVTGVSGSGKSSLVRDVLFQTMQGHLNGHNNAQSNMAKLTGDMHLIKRLEMVDQNPIGKSSRSNPCTYIKAYDEIRRLYGDQPLSKQMGLTPSFFSFNVEGGRCEACKGEGTIVVEMQFMADLELECEECGGKRFKPEVLEVTFAEKNIDDLLRMSVNEAITFFSAFKGATEKKIVKRLLPLQQVGLGYIALGQSSSTLSGGENQRVKLAYFLSQERVEPTLFIFDEPTTGLHFHDIKTLMGALNALIERGHTVVIIEHNLDVIMQADHLIDIGPDGGVHGGKIVFEGTPEQIIKCTHSHTGEALRQMKGA